MSSFLELFLSQCSTRIMELIATNDKAELRRLRSREFERALIAAARAVPVPSGDWMPYREVFKREFVAAGNLAEQCMVAKAMLISKHCLQEGVKPMLKVYRETEWETRIEVWINSCPMGTRMLPYRQGLYRQQIQILCEEMHVPYQLVIPFCDRLELCERYNPANTFPFTPDCEAVFWKMVRLAN